MGEVFAEITLRNEGDLTRARDGHIPEQEIRSLTVTAVVDTGAKTLVMGEKMREKLGLYITEAGSATLANGTKTPYSITEPVEIRWKDRKSSLCAWVLPDEEAEVEVLMGVIPLEEMDLMVDPVNQQLVGAHGDQPLNRL